MAKQSIRDIINEQLIEGQCGETVTDESIKDIIKSRTSQYGSATDVAGLTMELFHTMQADEGYHRLSDVAKMSIFMIFNKIARMVVGGSKKLDTLKDIAGYASLIEDDYRGYGDSIVGRERNNETEEMNGKNN